MYWFNVRLPFNKLPLRKDWGIKYELLCPLFLCCIFNLIVNEFTMNQSSEVSEDPHGSIRNDDFHMWSLRKPLHFRYFPNCLVGCVAIRYEEISFPSYRLGRFKITSKWRLIAASQEAGFMVGNTTQALQNMRTLTI